MNMRNKSFEQFLSYFEQISWHKIFSVCVLTYTTVGGCGMTNEESKTSVLNPLSLS